MATLTQAAIRGGNLELGWRDGDGPETLSLLWLRDHCPCPACLHPETRQRQVDTFALPAELAPKRVDVAENGRQLVIAWPDDPERPSSLVRRCAAGTPIGLPQCPAPTP